MNNDSILATFGGLPPSAFLLPDKKIAYADFAPSDQFASFIGDVVPQSDVDWDLGSLDAGPTAHPIEAHSSAEQGFQYRGIDDYSMTEWSDAVVEPLHRGSVGSGLEPEELQYLKAAVPKAPRNKTTALVRKTLEDFFKLELYPDKIETETIANRAGMSFQQVRQWFRNKRRRVPIEEMINIQTATSNDSLPLTKSSLEAHDGANAFEATSSISLPRSPSVPCIASSVSGSIYTPAMSLTSEISCQSGQSRMSYVSCVSGASRMSIASRSSRMSMGVTKNNKARKGRRIWQVPQGVDDCETSKTFRCTFHPCRKGFDDKYSWKRHEESVHYQAKAWVCAAEIPDVKLFSAACPYCAFKIEEPLGHDSGFQTHRKHLQSGHDPSCAYCKDPKLQTRLEAYCRRIQFDNHLNDHKHEACLSRPQDERTFFRKEHFKQHLASYHSVQNPEERAETVGKQIEKPPSALPLPSCPFCCFTFTSWTYRVDHVAAHFMNGEVLPP